MAYFKYYLFISLLLSITNLYACICPPPKSNFDIRVYTFYKSEFVFTGYVTSINENSALFLIEEIFKGKINNNFINLNIEESCSIKPNIGDYWVVYANKDFNDKLFANQCLASKKININRDFLKYPPLINATENEKEILKRIIDMKFRIEILDELNWLNRNKQISPNFFNIFNNIILILILILIVLISIFIIYLKNKRIK
jgi:hypothetical protein